MGVLAERSAKKIPSPSECLGVIGLGVGFLGGIIGLIAVLFLDVTPWGFVLFALSGWVAFSSVLWCILWGWEHLP